MLYKFGTDYKESLTLEPVGYRDFSDIGLVEKDLESLLNDHLLDLLFEDSPLMPIFRERSRQAEADLYALDASGNLVIFELKRAGADSKAALQVLRYCQEAGQWSYSDLQSRFDKYSRVAGEQSRDLSAAHAEAFQLTSKIPPEQFNRRQRLRVIGSVADDDLIAAVDYWKSQGLLIDFLPYRIYELKGDLFFELFSPPYDRHRNPAKLKGVLFDTNLSWNENSVWEMLERKRIAAYGGVKGVVDFLNNGDVVFLSHRGVGLVAAGRVTGPPKDNGPEERYRPLEFLTSVPTRETDLRNHSLSFGEVTEITGKSFYWARTIKVPYLSKAEADELVAAMKAKFSLVARIV